MIISVVRSGRSVVRSFGRSVVRSFGRSVVRSFDFLLEAPIFFHGSQRTQQSVKQLTRASQLRVEIVRRMIASELKSSHELDLRL
jgi:hypothetical protein